MAYEKTFSALAHPARQKILLTLRDRRASVRELTDHLGGSQPAVSQHLKVLREAGLVEAEAQGMKRLYRLKPEALAELKAFLEAYWTDFLTELDKEDPAK